MNVFNNKSIIARLACVLAAVVITVAGSNAYAEIKLKTPGHYSDQVTALFSQHHWSKGKELLDEGLSKWPNDPNLHYLAGRYWMNAKNYDKARYHLVKACTVNYRHVEAKQLLVNLEEATGNLTSAICYLNELLEVNPYSKTLWLRKIDLYKKTGNFEEANNLLKRLNIIYANDAYVSGEYYSVLENTYLQARRNGDLAKAEENLREMVHINPTNVEYQLAYANVILQRGRHSDAIDALSAALNFNPGNPELVRKNADILMEVGRDHEAVALVRGQMQQYPSPELRQLYQNMLEGSAIMQKEADSYALYSKVYATKHTSESLDYLLKESVRRGYHNDALTYIDEMRKRRGDSPALVMNRYRVYRAMGEDELAIKTIYDGVAMFPTSYDVNLQACRLRMDEAREAIADERYADAIDKLEFIRNNCVEEDYRAAATRRLFVCYKNSNRFQEAEEMLKERLRYDPVYLVNIEKANLYASKGKQDEALDIVYSAWLSTPADSSLERTQLVNAYEEIALPYLRQSREEGASPRVVDICDNLLAMDPTNYWGLRYAASSAKDPIDYVYTGFDYYPEDVYFRARKAALLSQREGRHTEALELLDPLLDEFPGDEMVTAVYSEVSLRYATELRKNGTYADAIPVLDSALVRRPDHKELRYERGLIYEKQRMWDSAYVYQSVYVPSFLEEKEYRAHMYALLNKMYKNRLNFSFDLMRFADSYQLTGMANITYTHTLKNKDTYSVRLGYTGRDVTLDPEKGKNPDALLGGRGLLLGGGWTHDFNPLWGIEIKAAWANQYFPQLSADVTVTRHFDNDLEGQAGAFYRLLEDDESDSMFGVNVSASKQWDHLYGGAKLVAGFLKSKLFFNFSGRFRFYPYLGGKNFLEVQAGAGTAPELSFLNYYYSASIYNHMNSFLSAGGGWLITPNIEVSLSGSWSTLYNLSSEIVNYRNLFIANVSFTCAF